MNQLTQDLGIIYQDPIARAMAHNLPLPARVDLLRDPDGSFMTFSEECHLTRAPVRESPSALSKLGARGSSGLVLLARDQHKCGSLTPK